MSYGPRIVVEDPQFRIVRVPDSSPDGGSHLVVEVPDGCDALGVERWREFQLNAKTLKALRDRLVAEVEKA